MGDSKVPPKAAAPERAQDSKEAFRKGAEAMRSECLRLARNVIWNITDREQVCREILALPLPAEQLSSPAAAEEDR